MVEKERCEAFESHCQELRRAFGASAQADLKPFDAETRRDLEELAETVRYAAHIMIVP
jgi:hypothetical protein